MSRALQLQQEFGRAGARTAEAEAMDTIAAAFTNHITLSEAIDRLTAIGTTTRCWSAPVAAGSDVIVSGDLDLLVLGSFRGINVAKVSEFVAPFRALKPAKDHGERQSHRQERL